MLSYNYEIVSVNPEQNFMEIKFTSEGREDVITGAELPAEGVSLDEHVHRYAPFGYWISKETKYVIPEVGIKGGYDHEAELERIRQLELSTQVQNVEPTLDEAQIEALIAQLKK